MTIRDYLTIGAVALLGAACQQEPICAFGDKLIQTQTLYTIPGEDQPQLYTVRTCIDTQNRTDVVILKSQSGSKPDIILRGKAAQETFDKVMADTLNRIQQKPSSPSPLSPSSDDLIFTEE